MLKCTGCGSTKTIAEIKADHPDALSCCPERDMQPEIVVTLQEYAAAAGADQMAVIFTADLTTAATTIRRLIKVLAEIEQMATASQAYVPGPLGQRLAQTVERARAALIN